MAIYRTQRTYAFKDYVNLTEKGAQALKAERSKIAKELLEKRKSIPKFDAPDAVRSNLDFARKEAQQKAVSARNEVFGNLENQSTKMVSGGKTNSMTMPKNPKKVEAPKVETPKIEQEAPKVDTTAQTPTPQPQAQPTGGTTAPQGGTPQSTTASGEKSPKKEGSWWSRQGRGTKTAIIGGGALAAGGAGLYGSGVFDGPKQAAFSKTIRSLKKNY